MGTITVTSLADDGSGGTLREAIAEAAASPGLDTILFADSLAGGTITLNDVLTFNDADYVLVNGDIGLDGVGDITISGNYENAFFTFSGAGGVALYDLTLTDGYDYSTSSEDTAALIRVSSGADAEFDGLTITNSQTRGYDAAFDSGETGSDATTILVASGGGLTIRNASIESSVTAIAGYGSDGGDLYVPSEGGDAIVGIVNNGKTYAENVGFAGLARGGKGGDGAIGYNDNGGDGGDAFVGIVNAGDLYAVSTPYVSAIGISIFTPPVLIGGGGGVRSGTGADGVNGATGTGIENNGGDVANAPVVGESGTQGPDQIADDSALTAQILLGLGGDDTLISSGGGDTLLGGDGSDTFRIYGTSYSVGGGTPTGGQNTFKLLTVTGDITIRGGFSSDGRSNVLDLSEMDVSGGSGAGVLLTLDEGSLSYARSGLNFDVQYVNDVIGTTGRDIITGNSYGNQLFGYGGSDDLFGGRGQDVLAANLDGDIRLSGGDDSDRLIVSNLVSAGRANIEGGEGLDAFLFYGDDAITVDLGVATEQNFSVLQNRTIVITEVENILAGSASDVITGSGAANQLIGGSGNDFLDGAGGADFIVGDNYNQTFGPDGVALNDTLVGRAGSDTLSGEAGNDELFGGDDNDSLFGGVGNDSLFGGDDTDELFGGANNDTLDGGSGSNTLAGDAGNDTLISRGNDVIDGGADNDLIQIIGGDTTVNGGSGSDAAQFFVNRSSVIFSEAGGDIRITSGGDTHTFENVETFFFADQTLSAAQIDAIINPAPAPGPTGPTEGDDTLFGTSGDDVIRALGGNDRVLGDSGNDNLNGQRGNDFVNGQRGNDTLLGGLGNDTMVGGLGSDDIKGSIGRDELRGLGGRDTLDGGGGKDNIVGGGGRDLIIGGKGADTLKGGGGLDIFQFKKGQGRDTITDFAQRRDKIEVTDASSFDQIGVSQQGDDVLIRGQGFQIRVLDDNASAFSAADFIFSGGGGSAASTKGGSEAAEPDDAFGGDFLF